MRFRVTKGMVSAATDSGLYGIAVPEQEMLQRLHRMVYRPLGLLPPMVRWLSPMRRWALLERQPQMMTIHYRNAIQDKAEDEDVLECVFEIPLPWTLQLVRIDEDFYPSAVALYGAKHQIESTKSSVFLLPMANLYISGFVCLPERSFAAPELHSVADSVTYAHTLAWQGGFNHDLNAAMDFSLHAHGMPSPLRNKVVGKPTPLKVYREWEKFTIQDVLQWDYLRPMGWDTVAEPNDGAVPHIGQVMNIARGIENELLNMDPISYYLNSALYP